jgi:hypothetical protein
MPPNRETGCYCPDHIKAAEHMADLEARLKVCDEDRKDKGREIPALRLEVAHLRGLHEGSMPTVQADVKKCFSLIEDMEASNNITAGQTAQNTKSIENAEASMRSLASRESLSWTTKMVYGGFLVWGLSILGLIIYMIVAKLSGVPLP